MNLVRTACLGGALLLAGAAQAADTGMLGDHLVRKDGVVFNVNDDSIDTPPACHSRSARYRYLYQTANIAQQDWLVASARRKGVLVVAVGTGTCVGGIETAKVSVIIQPI